MRAAYLSAALLFAVLGASVALCDACVLARFVAAMPDAIGAALALAGFAAHSTRGARLARLYVRQSTARRFV